MPRRKRPKHESRYQRTQRLIEERQCGLLPVDPAFPCPCPKRNGPEHPHPDHPGMVWCRACSGCKYFVDLYLNSHVCTHPNAHQTASKWLADALRCWEEQQAARQQLRLL
jgi:hypothetical protein